MNRVTIDVIENAVTIPDVLKMNGANIGRRRRCACPICGSKRDAFSYTDNLFHCFSCGESGGVIQLEAVLNGTSNDKACDLLSRYFGLNISNRPFSAEDKENYMVQKRIEESYAEYEADKRSYYTAMTNLFRNIRNVPELYDMAKDLRDWLDDNLNGVMQPWTYQATN